MVFTYYNPVYQFGVERFAREAAGAGVAGAIVPDVALEESAELRAALQAKGLAMPLLVAPSTPQQRAARIADAATGFVYVVSRLGVTGTGSAVDFAPLRRQLASLRELTNKPLAVGFGLSRPQDVRSSRNARGWGRRRQRADRCLRRYARARSGHARARVRRSPYRCLFLRFTLSSVEGKRLTERVGHVARDDADSAFLRGALTR